MQVQAINTQNNQTSFGAKIIIKTKDMQTYMDYLARFTNAEKPYYNSSKDLDLLTKFLMRLKNTPQKKKLCRMLHI